VVCVNQKGRKKGYGKKRPKGRSQQTNRREKVVFKTGGRGEKWENPRQETTTGEKSESRDLMDEEIQQTLLREKKAGRPKKPSSKVKPIKIIGGTFLTRQ